MLAGLAAGVLAAALAGPWPLPATSVLWRGPLAGLALAVAWWRWRRFGSAIALPVMAALALDATLPWVRSSAGVAQALSARVRGIGLALAEAAEGDEVRRLFLAEGGAVDPETPFAQLDALARGLPGPPDALLLADERGEPVAWAGRSARLPVRLRLLGEPAAVAEPGFRKVHLWWRAPVLDHGKHVGALLASTAMAEVGVRRVLGVWAGRGGAIVPLLDGGERVVGLTGAPVMGVRVVPAPPLWWSTPGLALGAALLLLAFLAPMAWRGPSVVGAVTVLLVMGDVPRGWLIVAGAAALALAHAAIRHRRWARWAIAGLAAAVVALFPPLLAEFEASLRVGSLLAPGLLTVALATALTALLSAPAADGGQPWAVVARVVGWVLVVVGFHRSDVTILACGVAVAVLARAPARSVLAGALMASATVVTAWDTIERRHIVASTESTLARLQHAEGPARRFLASLPESGLAALARMDAGEALVILGRFAEWAGLGEHLPGTAFVLRDADGHEVTGWGPVEPGGGRVMAERALVTGGSVAVIAPSRPFDVLESLASRGVDAPLAVFDRSGAPRGRGATFKPLPPEVVGRALAAERSWGTVGVGEREFAAYLRAWGDTVLAVPWIRPPSAERALLLAAVALWGGLPMVVFRERRRLGEWWRERTTFVGRTRLLTAATALLPVLLLGQLLPVQWLRQQQRSRLEFGRAVAAPLVQLGWSPGAAALAQEMGGGAGVYRGGRLVAASRPDLVVRGELPALPPRTAYVRAIRGWGEPVVEGKNQMHVFVAAVGEPQPTVLAVVGIPAAGLLGGSSPREWFAVTGVLAVMVALAAAETLGRRLSRPLRTVVQAAARLERGEPLQDLPLSRDEDVAALGRAFATMAATVQRREEELRRQRDLLETVLDTLSAAVLVATPSGAVELANPAARALLGPDGTIDELAAHFGSGVTSMLAAGAAGTPGEEMLHPPVRPESVWRVTVRPLDRPAGRVLVVMEDLSEFARAERLASLAELARIVAHEVKNPLTPIRLWAEELREALRRGADAVVEVARVASEQILDRVEHLKAVTQGFSNLVALERWDPHPVSLGTVAREVTGEYAVLAQRGVAILVDAEADVQVVADPDWVRRGIRHLLENSARALASKGGTIVVRVGEEEGLAVLTVRDTGGGVADEHLARLFEPFFSTTSDGSGLGLAVVRRVAERAGGRATARNVAGGLEVRLVFPLAHHLVSAGEGK